jgi:peptidoglycan/xylan/chitin deacetylase (PgdA/CDA1 family)
VPRLFRGSTVPRVTLACALLVSACTSPAGSPRAGSAAPPAVGASASATSSVVPTGPTIVSLTFDDGIASAYNARLHLADHGMHATFYVNSGHLDQGSFMTRSQVKALSIDGNEIGGHTALHANLPALDADEAERQICDDRVVLLDAGYDITDFAYPFGGTDAALQALPKKCGYNSARTTSGIKGAAETVPPANRYAIGIGNDATPTLTEIEDAITGAVAAGGGWVPILLHGICDGCSTMAVSETDFETLLSWLDQQRSNDVTVRTVHEVIGGSVRRGVDGPAPPPAPYGSNAVQNPSLEDDANGDGVPDCWSTSTPGDAAAWTTTLFSHRGSVAERVDVAGPVNGSPRLAIFEDLGQCTPSVVPGHRYRITAWYKSTVPVNFTTHSRSRTTFSYWEKSPAFPPSSDWALAAWVTSTIPTNVDGLSFGISISEKGSMSVDDLGIDDAAATPG